MTWTTIGIIAAVASLLLHAIPKRNNNNNATPSPTPSPMPSPTPDDGSSSSDRFKGLPGIDGHAVLNFLFDRLFRKQAESEASDQLVELIKNDPATKAKVKEALRDD